MLKIVSLCFLFAMVLAAQVEKTVSGLEPKNFEFGNKTYLISPEKGDWYVAKMDCRIRGMELVSIETQEEQLAIAAAIAEYDEPFWISGNNHGLDRYFSWDSTGHYFGQYRNFAPNQTGSGGELGCFILDNSAGYAWKSILCETGGLLRFICEESLPQTQIVDVKRVFQHGNKGYELSALMLNWEDAKNDCHVRGMELVSIEIEEEQNAINNYTEPLLGFTYNGEIWTSLTQKGRLGDFYWDSTGEYVGPFTNWLADFPGPLPEHNCVQLHGGGHLWHNYLCSKARRYICEYNL